MMHINAEQRKAIEHQGGPCLLLAGPGSGKTFTIIKRIEYMITKLGVNPKQILVLTFSKSAAMEMKERCNKQISLAGDSICFGTFHSFFFMLLRRYQNYQVSDVVKDEDYQYFFDSDVSQESIQEEIYQEWKKSEGKLDYQDMEHLCYKMLTEKKNILKKVQEQYRYILVDEFQDISEIQYRILCLLMTENRDFMVVGDDDQSIYGFRGASPQIIFDLRQDFPEIKILKLVNNYRCPKGIVFAANRLIGHNSKRYEKKMRSIYQKNNKSSLILKSYRNPSEEYKQIIKIVHEMGKNGIAFEDIAILTRTKKELQIFWKAAGQQIPMRYGAEKQNIYENFIFHDLWAYLKVSSGSRKRKYFVRIINCPQRYLSCACLEHEEVDFQKMISWYGWDLQGRTTIEEFRKDILIMSEMTPYVAIQYICQKIGYGKYLKEYAKENEMDVRQLYGILDVLLEESKRYRLISEWEREIQKADQRMKIDEEKGVHLLTIHKSKGLEFPYVFILGAHENNIPQKSAVSVDELEEERRLFYVALTRTKEKCFISYAQEKNGKAVKPSRFITEMKIYSDSEYKDSK